MCTEESPDAGRDADESNSRTFMYVDNGQEAINRVKLVAMELEGQISTIRKDLEMTKVILNAYFKLSVPLMILVFLHTTFITSTFTLTGGPAKIAMTLFESLVIGIVIGYMYDFLPIALRYYRYLRYVEDAADVLSASSSVTDVDSLEETDHDAGQDDEYYHAGATEDAAAGGDTFTRPRDQRPIGQ